MIRDWLSALLRTQVQTVRFPPLHSSKPDHPIPSASISSLLTATKDPTQKARDKASRLPGGGGPFKTFCFAVLGGLEAAELANTEWSWDRAEPSGPRKEDEVVEDRSSSNEDIEEEQPLDGDATMAADSADQKDGDRGDAMEPDAAKKKPPHTQLSPEEQARRFGFRGMPM